MVMGTSLILAVGMLLAVLLSGAFAAPPAAHSEAPLTLAGGSTQQWAFGGTASASYNCPTSICNSTSEIHSLTLRYYVGWVVIYTATTISSTQTEYEVQSAINASVSLSLAGCVNESVSGPCSPISASANLAGKETAVGFSNVTSTGTVNIVEGPDAGTSVAALALMNAQSNEALNFSGSYSESLPVNGTTETANIGFDLGGNETTTVNFPTPLGIVPISPQSGQVWNSSEPYSATGSYTSGYTVSATVNGHTESEGDWTNLVVSPSGTLTVNGTDLGPFTLWDNYTTPATTTTGQLVVLTFSNGEFSGTDGWLMTPTGIYDGADGFLGGVTLIASQHPAQATVSAGPEAVYYQQGPGFVGVDESVNSTAALGTAGGPQVSLQAGPEPLSVAQQQYSGITSTGGSGSSGFPTTILILAVVVVVVVIIGVLVMVRRPARRRPAQDAGSPMPTGAYAGWVPPTPPSPPQGGVPPPPPPPGA